MYYLMDANHNVVRCNVACCNDIATWHRTWALQRIIQQDNFKIIENGHRVKVKISTVFLGINPATDSYLPLFFETMVFGGKYDELGDRCSTYEEALNQHRRAISLVTSDQTVLKKKSKRIKTEPLNEIIHLPKQHLSDDPMLEIMKMVD